MSKLDNKLDFKSILIYSLSFSISLGFNGLVTTIFKQFGEHDTILAQTVYVLILSAITLAVGYFTGSNVAN